MKLTIKDRFTILQILPKEGNFLTLKIIRDLQNKVGFSEQDYKDNSIVIKGDGSVKWDSDKDNPKDIKFGPQAKEIIKNALEQLDKTEKLNVNQIGTYEKFVKK